ncbi:MAG: endonuclease NucS domain-containing protein, partial [candidate division NC10 bacterium]
STPIFTLDAAGLRKMLARQPELLEPGLNIVTDEKGRLVGSGYATDVGTIDLLARDAKGGLVVVTVAESGQGEEVVAEMLQRIGWVRKNLGKGKQKVRGIVVLEQVPKNLSYAAAAVADTIAFKTYWVALTFGDVEV